MSIRNLLGRHVTVLETPSQLFLLCRALFFTQPVKSLSYLVKLYYSCLSRKPFSILYSCPVGQSCRILRLHSCREVRPPTHPPMSVFFIFYCLFYFHICFFSPYFHICFIFISYYLFYFYICFNFVFYYLFYIYILSCALHFFHKLYWFISSQKVFNLLAGVVEFTNCTYK